MAKKTVKAPETKAMFNVRLDTEMRKAIEKAADDAGHTAAGFARHVLREWLRANGYLK
jgi:uncharacterized protein (DUF1778 family)